MEEPYRKMVTRTVGGIKRWVKKEIKRIEKRKEESLIMSEQNSLSGSLITLRKIENYLGGT